MASLPVMALPLSVLTPGRTVHLRLDGEVLTGAVIATANGWLRLTGAVERPVPTAKNLGAQPGSRVPGRPWPDETIRAVVEGFLNDAQDGELAERHGRTRHQITILRQAWECARGNLADDQLSPAAQLWVARIRNAMRP